MRFLSLKLIFALLLTTTVVPAFSTAQAQNPAADVVMVLPFENTSNRAEYNWVGESFADALAELLNKPGLIVVSSDERELAYQQLRLPETVIPSRATAIKLARQAKATMIVIGSYSVTPPATAEATTTMLTKRPLTLTCRSLSRVIKVNEGRTLGEVMDGGWATRQFDYGGCADHASGHSRPARLPDSLSTRQGAALLAKPDRPGSHQDSAEGF